MRLVLLFSLIAAPALAEAPAGAQSAFGILPPILLTGVIFFFLIFRPQQKKFKEHQAMLSAIAKGDNVITGGGLHGKVTKVNDDGTLVVQIASGVEVTAERSTVANVQVKKTPEVKLANADAPKQVVKKPARKKASNDNG